MKNKKDEIENFNNKNNEIDNSNENNTKNKHDERFKNLMGDPEIFIEFLDKFYKIEGITAKDLKLEKTDFLDANLNEYKTDVLYSIKKNKETIYVYILLEHQKTVDHLMAYRMMNYTVKIWEHYMKLQLNTEKGAEKIRRKSFKLPPVIPIVFYNGSSKWTSELNIRKKIKHYEKYKEYLPSYEYKIIEINEMKDFKISEIKTAFEVFLALDKEKEDITPVLEEMMEVIKKLPQKELEKIKSHAQIIISLMKESDVPEEEIEKVKEIKEVPKMFENVVKETKKAQKLAYKAGEYNNKIETAKKMLKARLQIEQIVEFTGLPIETIKKLMKEMK